MAYDALTAAELEAMLRERATARRCALSVRQQLEGGAWLVSMIQTTPLGISVVQSAEGDDLRHTMIALLEADDFAYEFERRGGEQLGG